jgi:endonuclease/exonuclease/phosphatase family metal-dependent hydrolase
MLTILSYNVEFGNKINEIYKWISDLKEKPQIICFQEFPEDEVEKLNNKKIFNNQNIFFAKGLSTKEKYYGEITIIDASKIKFFESKYLDFGPDHLESIFRRRIIKRSALVIEFKINNEIYSLANIHLTPASFHGKRRKQLTKVIEETKTSKAIIVGDFNYSSLLNKKGLISFMNKYNYDLAGEHMITNKFKYKIPQQLDYVFYKNMNHNKTEVFDLPYSDHFPVVSRFSA